VQLTTFGRKLTGQQDALVGYHLSSLQITDQAVIAASGEAVHPVLSYTGSNADKVEGVVFDITSEELVQADLYEVSDYKRIQVILCSGVSAWVYVKAGHTVGA
jgi:hypothetical protein